MVVQLRARRNLDLLAMVQAPAFAQVHAVTDSKRATKPVTTATTLMATVANQPASLKRGFIAAA